MPDVVYRQPDGSERRVAVPIGHSVMEGAIRNNVPGIVAECGGNCACGTCHVFVDAMWIDRLAEKAMLEDAMLMVVPDLRPNSRLSCQIAMTETLDGLTVEIPERQR